MALGTTIAWASIYYLPAVLATPIVRDLGLSVTWGFAAFSLAMIISAIIGPWGGRRIDRLGGRSVLVASNIIFALGLILLANTPNRIIYGLVLKERKMRGLLMPGRLSAHARFVHKPIFL